MKVKGSFCPARTVIANVSEAIQALNVRIGLLFITCLIVWIASPISWFAMTKWKIASPKARNDGAGRAQ